jgi:hypothetical protein
MQSQPWPQAKFWSVEKNILPDTIHSKVKAKNLSFDMFIKKKLC